MRWRLALGLCAAASAAAAAAPEAAPTVLEPVTVTATRVPVPGLEVPAAITAVQAGEPGLGASLGEWLQGVPGLLARERQNYAQDTQISIRGFGARAPFGIRGVRLLVDGIPATQPDGQGQISHFNLASAGRVEVLRGPFSALYGNSSGGVIQLFTEDGAGPLKLDLAAFGDSYGNQRLSLAARGGGATLGYSELRTDGFRGHSAARRSSLNVKVDANSGAGGKLSLLLNHFDAPLAQDPLGLSRNQFETAPRQAAPVAEQFNTRKSVRQTQFGLIYEQDWGGPGALRLLGYGGQRGVEQYLAIPVAAQANPRHSGGVVDLGSRYYGGDARWTARHGPLALVAGLSADGLSQHRRGYENFAAGQLGVRGRLRRDELNTVTNFDQYLQLDATLSPRWSALAGARHSVVRFDSRDQYLRPGNPDDSGALRYSAVTPVGGLLFRQSPRLHWYAAYGSGFETPTFAELAYRPDGEGGLNLALVPARSRNAEAGLKLRMAPATRLGLALFRVEARDELVTVSNAGGRASFANAARTRRQGAEGSLEAALPHQLSLGLAYTWLDATVRAPYRTCLSLPCTTPQGVVASGSRLPGVARSQLWSRLAWKPLPQWQLSGEFRHLGTVQVNDSNTESAPAYGVVDLASSYRLAVVAGSSLRLSLRVENLLDEHYAGSVIVNDANGRYYEPAPGRSLLAGLEWQL